MKIYRMEYLRSFAGPGMDAIDAEMEVVNDEGETVFLTYNMFDEDHFSVREESIMPFLKDAAVEPPEEIETYEGMEEASVSVYAPFFVQLRNMSLDLYANEGEPAVKHADLWNRKESITDEYTSENDYHFEIIETFTLDDEAYIASIVSTKIPLKSAVLRYRVGRGNDSIESFSNLKDTDDTDWSILFAYMNKKIRDRISFKVQKALIQNNEYSKERETELVNRILPTE